tara:strand:+ start:237 stop:1430 length:1194 start_codon:yes stop_codon:yes gene_type:complete
MAVNIPVRLVRKDGETIPLNVTTLTLDVDRSINPHTIPFAGGERFAFDLNMSKAVILLEGVITDDDLVSLELGRGASASIDFSRRRELRGYQPVTTNLIGDGAGNDLTSLAESMTADSFDHKDTPELTLKAADNEEAVIYFIKSSTAQGYNLGGSSNKYHVAIHDNSDMNTAVEIATNLTNLINSSAGPTSNALSSRFTASLETSTHSGEANTVVKITQDTVGKAGNNNFPSFKAARQYTPIHTRFKGGRESGNEFASMSAGDKVMSLYATLNNSNDGGSIVPLINATQRIRTGNKLNTKYGDYIKGIQIPFNSTIGNTGGDKYVAKNFFMPTGPFHDQDSKHPEQAENASSEVSNPQDNNDKAFIKGTVTKATFVQIGGEPIYQFNIQFVPVDHII